MPIAAVRSSAPTTMFASSGSSTQQALDMMTVIAEGICDTIATIAITGIETGASGTPPTPPIALGTIVCPGLVTPTLASTVTTALAAKSIVGPALAPFILGLCQLGNLILTVQVSFVPICATGAIVAAAGGMTFVGKSALEIMKLNAASKNLVNQKTGEVTQPTADMLEAIATAFESAFSTAVATVPVAGGIPVVPPVPYGPLPNPTGKFL